jgi:hypothetical protein
MAGPPSGTAEVGVPVGNATAGVPIVPAPATPGSGPVSWTKAATTTAGAKVASAKVAGAKVAGAKMGRPRTGARPTGTRPTGTGPTGTRPMSNAAAAATRRSARVEPRLRQLMGVCGWAAVLGGIGLVIGLRGQVGILTGQPPSWYEPSLIAVGVVGILLTVGAFLTVHRKRAPWIFLGSSSVALIVAMSLTSNAF